MIRPKRTAQPSELRQRIITAAWEQIAADGAPALTLRGVARALHITAPAIYNYFPDRDALVTALIIEAFTSFGDSQIAARDALPAQDLKGRMKAIGLAYRNWAIAYPQRYQLIFGTPIPGYVAPVEQVLPASARSLGALVSVVEALCLAGSLHASGFPGFTPGYEKYFELWKGYAGETDSLSLAVALHIWSRVHGLVSLEIGGNLPPFGPQGDALYRYELDSIERQFFKE
jgi:AcrR family transcriptional regulator